MNSVQHIKVDLYMCIHFKLSCRCITCQETHFRTSATLVCQPHKRVIDKACRSAHDPESKEMGRVTCPCAFLESPTLIRPSIPNKISIVPLRYEMVGVHLGLWLSLLSSFKALFPLCALLWTSKTFIVRVLIS
jgi:hypothetical protein